MAFLEMQPGYQRGHLSRVVAIYNSLSSPTTSSFKTIDAAAAPVREGRAGSGDEGTLFKTGFSEGPILAGLPVISNQVRMVHAEQILDLGGSIDLDGSGQLVNRSSLELSDAIVVEKDDERGNQDRGGGSVSEVARQRSCGFVRFEDVTLPDDLPMQVGLMLNRLASPDSIPSGSMRLVARYDGAIEGMTITPDTHSVFGPNGCAGASQAPCLAPTQVDVNLIGDFRQVLTDEDERPASESDSDEVEN